MTIRFIQPWNGYQVGQVATLAGGTETALINGGLARASTDNDNSGVNDLATEVNALKTRATALETVTAAVATNYADDAAAATGGVAVGSLYNTTGAVKVRAA